MPLRTTRLGKQKTNPNIKDRWKPGCTCTICGLEIKEEHFSDVDFERRYEKKWGVHYACTQKVQGVLDRNTR